MKTPSLPTGKTRWIAIAIAVIALGGILAFWLLRDHGEPDALRLYGNVDIREVELAFRQPGRLTAMAFDEGDAVTPGAVMAQLDATPYREEFAWLNALPAGASLEGFLFPDTYVVAPAPGFEKDLVRMMLTRFDQVVSPVYDDRPDPAGLKLYQAVTLASIVEKEARHAEERPTIAGVFYNRLATHMPFGSDPTVEYALNKHQGAKGLSFKDVAVDSPYNTYKHAGLPPGPIANPGLASVQAVLSPEKTPYLYFVARGDGSHAFTRTYAEHLATQRAIWAARR